MQIRDADAIDSADGKMNWGASASSGSVLRSRRPQTRLEASCTRTGRPQRLLLGRTSRTAGEGSGRTTRLYVSEESDSGIACAEQRTVQEG